jgi:hypothetical protein
MYVFRTQLSPGQNRKHFASVNVSQFAQPGNIVAETKFASREAKMFPNKF